MQERNVTDRRFACNFSRIVYSYAKKHHAEKAGGEFLTTFWQCENMSESGQNTYTVPQGGQGNRIDALLARIVPDMGLRGRRRMFAEGRVLVNGRPARAGQTARAGDVLSVAAGGYEASCLSDVHGVSVVTAGNGFVALYKPVGLHTAAHAGGTGESLEALLGRIPLSALPALEGGCLDGFDSPILLTRLDRETSGLVLAACNAEREQWFRRAEAGGGVRKTYLALVRGRVEKAMCIDTCIAMDGGKQSRVRGYASPDASRHTGVFPMRVFSGEATSLVRVTIARGARHQIRAHLASVGYPLAGDSLYGGGEPLTEGPGLYLHHIQVQFEGFTAFAPPSGGLWTTLYDSD